jgi:outer membrane lipoprotein SlyB
MNMKRVGYLLAIAVVGISLTGCMTPQGQIDNTASGALAGGATGAIIGSMAHHPGTGALVGGAVGALAGGAIGHSVDQAQEAQQMRAQQPQQVVHRVEQGPPLTVVDIKALVKAGVGDDLIISQIRNSRTVYRLKTEDIIDLKRARVSEKIIDCMINTPTDVQSTEVVRTEQPAPLREQVVVAPGPGYIWVDGTWLWLSDRWVWHSGYWHHPLRYGGHRGWRRW